MTKSEPRSEASWRMLIEIERCMERLERFHRLLTAEHHRLRDEVIAYRAWVYGQELAPPVDPQIRDEEERELAADLYRGDDGPEASAARVLRVHGLSPLDVAEWILDRERAGDWSMVRAGLTALGSDDHGWNPAGAVREVVRSIRRARRKVDHE